MYQLTAAHKTLPFDTRVRVTNLDNGLETIVRVNDRGPFIGDRIIDLSFAAAKKLNMIDNGTASVELQTTYYPSHIPTTQNLNSKIFGVQVGFFNDLRNANELKSQTQGSFIQKVNSSDGESYRVVVGSYNDFDQTWNLLNILKSKGFPRAFVIDY